MKKVWFALWVILLGGCVQPGAVNIPPKAVQVEKGAVEVAAPKVEVQPGAVKVAEGSQANFQVDAVWELLRNFKLTLEPREDTLGAGATQAKSSPVITVNPVVTTKLLEVDGVVVAVIIIAIGAGALLILRERLARRDAGDWREVAGAVTDAVEEQRAEGVKASVERRTANRPRLRAKLDADLRDKGYLASRCSPAGCPGEVGPIGAVGNRSAESSATSPAPGSLRL
jgi:hypothetical protein